VDIVARLTAQVRRGLKDLPGLEHGLVAAVSGGPDSVALLRLLLAFRGDKAPLPLVIAHLNHQLRGADSDADEAFVSALHASLTAAGVPTLALACQRRDVAAEAHAAGANLEATARAVRYRWLAEVARAHGMAWVATGHTASDQAETVLHRLLRGAGLAGLRGIAPRREIEPGVSVVRPLLQAKRAEVLECLRCLDQPWREDRSNDDLDYTRNRIRHQLLPLLAEQYNPGIAAVLARLAHQAEELHRDEQAAAAALLQQAERPRAGLLIILDTATLERASRSALRALFRLLWQREGWPMAAMGFDAWQRLADVALGDCPAMDLPGPIHARRRGSVIQVGLAWPQNGRSAFPG